MFRRGWLTGAARLFRRPGTVGRFDGQGNGELPGSSSATPGTSTLPVIWVLLTGLGIYESRHGLSYRKVVATASDETSVPDLEALAELMRRQLWADRLIVGRVASGYTESRHGEQRLEGRLWLAPHGRYRAELTGHDGVTEMRISDGDSVWFIQDGRGYQFDVTDTVMPLPDLMDPGWLFAEYQLQVGPSRGRQAGRMCFVLNGTKPAETPGFFMRDVFPRGGTVEALVDCELGLLLSYVKSKPHGTTDYAEFTGLEVHDVVDAGLFRPPADTPIVDDRAQS